ncbi:MAG TPA: glycosyltransferase family 1 protein, partial [Acidobacteriaceae bacterium]
MLPAAGLNGHSHRQAPTPRPTILCFSHLRWNFVYQRPQHLMTRAAANARVYFLEEPLQTEAREPSLRVEDQPEGVQVLTPILPHGYSIAQAIDAQRALLDQWLLDAGIVDFIAWYYTPMALLFTSHLAPAATVYDCMDQLSAFQGAPPELVKLEQELFARADVVFTGGRSLFAEKRGLHPNVHLFPSSVDRAHFAASRLPHEDPEDQASIPHPRIGFFGVLDERLNRELIATVAACEPAWQLIFVGPVVKIREDELPRAANIHY